MADLARLVVRLEAQSAQLTAELQRAKSQLGKFDNDVSAMAGKIGRGIGLAATAAAAGFAAMVKSNLDAADELSKLSQKVGIATDELSKLSHAAKLADVDSGQLKKSLVVLGEAAADAQDGIGPAAAAFKALGVNINEIKDPRDRFLAVADAFASVADGAGKTSAAVAIFGAKLGPDLIPLLNGGRQAIQEAGDELQRFGGVVTPEAGRQAELFNDNLSRLGIAAKGLANQIISPLLPAINDLTTAMLAQVDNTKNVETAYSKIIPVFKELVFWGANFEAGLKKIRAAALNTAQALAFPTLSNIQQQLDDANKEFDAADENVRRVERSLHGLGNEAQRAGMKLQDALDPLATASQIPFRTGPDLLLRPEAGNVNQKPQLDFNAEAMEMARKAQEDAAKKSAASRKTAADAARREEEAARKSIESTILSLEQSIETYGASAEATMRYRVTQGDLAETFDKAGLGADALRERLVALTAEQEKQLAISEQLNAGLAAEESQRGAVKTIQDQISGLQQATFELGNNAESVMRYRTTQGDLAETFRLAGAEGEKYREELIRLAAANEAAADKTKDTWTVFADQAARNMQDAFAEFLFDPFKGGLEEMYLNFANTLRRMAAEAAAAQLFESMGFGKTSGGGGGGAPAWVGLLNTAASIYTGGGFGGTKPISSGTMPASTMTGTAPVVESFNMPARAHGGPVTASQPYMVGERGPEMFVPSISGQIVANDQMGGDKRVTQVFNIATPDANSFALSERQIARRARRAVA